MPFRVTFNGTRRPKDEYEADLADDEYASKWTGGTVVEMDDLPVDVVTAIADAESVGWATIYYSPAGTPARLQRVLEAMATHAGVEVPSPAETMGAFFDRYDNWLETSQPIEEKPFTDGFPPTPGEPASGSSSTSPGDTDGPQTLSDANPSEGS